MKTRHAVLVKVKGGVFFLFIPKRDYSTIASIEEGNVQNEPERMLSGATVIMSCALFWREKKKELKPVG